MIRNGLADSPLFKNPKRKTNKVEKYQYTMAACNHDTMVGFILKSIKEIGREASTYRFSKKEKLALLGIIYKLRMHNISISENEIIRIGILYLIYDFNKRNNTSLLMRIKRNNCK